ncbi:MAG: hypothetical protein QNK37_26145 [Acidobacteriota bacterium]|nr:hypothetical protein [Acidobacteriota bacterium]
MRKLILSRKGFDSSSGGTANPILPDGRLVPLPIPDAQAPVCYDRIQSPAGSLGPLVERLTRGKVGPLDGAHLDPDLDASSLPRSRGWRPLFGQAGAAQGHLNSQGVGPGDLFLFFGWFRQLEETEDGYRFSRDAADRHVIYGWFQIEEVCDLARSFPGKNCWQRAHPHCHGERGANNTLYIAARRLTLPGLEHTLPGAGLFSHCRDDLVLTLPGGNRAIWRLPEWFHPDGRDSTLSYHARLERWSRDNDCVRLDSAKRGQEFVLDVDHYPEAIDWAARLIGRNV